MTEQPPYGNYPPPPGGYPPQPPPGGYLPPPPYGGYPPPPPPGSVDYPPAGYTPQAQSGFVEIPGVGPVRVATIGQRMLARLIDTVIWCVVVGGLFFSAVVLSAASEHTVTDQYGQTTTEPSGIASFVSVLALLVAMPFWLLYEWLMVGLLGATLGKMALGIRVVNQGTGAILGLGAAFVRVIIPFIGFFVCYVGALVVYLSALLDGSGRFQGWHDRAANDLVIKPR